MGWAEGVGDVNARQLAVLGLVAALLGACGGARQEEAAVVPELTATPLEHTTLAAPTTPTPSPSPAASPRPSPSPSPGASRAPTDSDRGRFAADYRPPGASDLEFAAADVDGDEVKELVFVYVDTERDLAAVDIAWWDGREYSIGASGVGGPAIRIDRLRISDVNLDELIEVATFESTNERSSLSLWQVPGTRKLVALRARGGCVDGSHVYGAVGARFIDPDGDGVEEIEATCNEAPLPISEWRSDRYAWDDGAYRHVPAPEPSPSGSPSPTESRSPTDDDQDDG